MKLFKIVSVLSGEFTHEVVMNFLPPQYNFFNLMYISSKQVCPFKDASI